MGVMRDFFAETERDATAVGRGITGMFEHHHHAAQAATQTPAQQPVNLVTAPAAADTNGGTVSLTTLEDDVKADLTQGLDYILDFGQRLKNAAPGIIATSEAVGSSTVSALVEAVAGKILPPQVEQIAADFVKDLVGKYGQAPAAVAAPVAAPVTPAQ